MYVMAQKLSFRQFLAAVKATMTMLVHWCCLFHEVSPSFVLIAADVLQMKQLLHHDIKLIPCYFSYMCIQCYY